MVKIPHRLGGIFSSGTFDSAQKWPKYSKNAQNSPIVSGNIQNEAHKRSFRSGLSGLPHFLPKMGHFGAVMAIFLIDFEQRSASQHRPKQSKQSKIKYHTTFFFTIPLPKQIKKVVITTKIPVKQPH